MNQRYTFHPGRVAALLVLAAMALPPAMAQTLDFGSCVRIEDLSARLACYDRAAGRGTGATPTPAPAPAPTPPPAPRATVPAPVPPAVTPVPAPAQAPAADPTASFGATRAMDPLTSPTAPAKRVEQPELPRQIEAKITSVRTRPAGEQVLTLDNGQVWEQTEVKREPRYAVGDTVIIRRGMLGSFMVTLSKGSASSRIRRIS